MVLKGELKGILLSFCFDSDEEEGDDDDELDELEEEWASDWEDILESSLLDIVNNKRLQSGDSTLGRLYFVETN